MRLGARERGQRDAGAVGGRQPHVARARARLRPARRAPLPDHVRDLPWEW